VIAIVGNYEAVRLAGDARATLSALIEEVERPLAMQRPGTPST
jgi:hypothetical protein